MATHAQQLYRLRQFPALDFDAAAVGNLDIDEVRRTVDLQLALGLCPRGGFRAGGDSHVFGERVDEYPHLGRKAAAAGIKRVDLDAGGGYVRQ